MGIGAYCSMPFFILIIKEYGCQEEFLKRSGLYK